MKRGLCILLALCLMGGVIAEGMGRNGSGLIPVARAEGDDSEVIPLGDAEEIPESEEEGDDSEPVPLEMMDDEELEAEEVEVRVMQYGDEGDDVKELQSRLKALHYYTGNLSGRYREGTRDAIKKFQEDFELEASGVADLQTQSLLYATIYRPLRFGSSGDDVKELQIRLAALGYYKGKNSGNYLEATRGAVESFQEMNGMEVDGVADPDTQAVIFSGSAISKGGDTVTPTPAPELSAYLVDDEAENSTVVMSGETVAYSKKLKNGSTGKLVKQLQERMAALGYYDGPISGNFLVKTTRAVKKIQEQNGMTANGVVDETTWNLIFNDPLIVMPDATPKPTPSPTPVPFAITVDVANQVTTVYGRDENGEYTVVVRQMLCSTGLKATPSDVGDWVLNGRKANWCYFPKWGSYARYWTRINASIAFHSVIYTAVSLNAMNTSSYKKLGSRASHGCIRLTVADAKWIYDNVGAGTVVSIVEGMKADPELRDALKLAPLNSKGTDPVSTPEPTPEPDYDPADVPELGKKVLKEKDSDPIIYWAQRRLTELGYYTGKCSGKLLGGTKSALSAFQRAVGIYPSGTVTQQTLEALAEQPEATEIPAPEEAPSQE